MSAAPSSPTMQEAWIQLQCPACETYWERAVADLPETDASFDCKDCGESRPLSEFAKTARDLEILRNFAAQ